MVEVWKAHEMKLQHLCATYFLGYTLCVGNPVL
jgi:hypothetical protein